MVVLLRRFHPGRSVLCSLVAVAICYGAALCILEKRGFWITDNANKFLQVQALANSRYTDFSIPWPGQVVDPAFAYNPLPYYFTRVESGTLYSVFSPVFALISALSFVHFGPWGLYLLPVLSALVMLAGLAQLARLVAPRIAVGHVAVLTAGLCTPVFFYSLAFWEHTPAICLGIWSVRYLLQFLAASAPKHLCLGMAAAGLSVYFRDEFYLLCLVLALATAFCASAGRLKVLVSSALLLFVSLLPLWLFQWLTIGHPLGYHLSTHLSTAADWFHHLEARPRVFYNLFAASNPIPALSLVLALPFLLAFVCSPRFARPALQRAVPAYSAVALISGGLSLGGYFFAASPIDYMLKSSNALFASAPFVALAFLRSADSAFHPFRRWIWLVALSFAALYALAAPKVGSMGIHWGNRYFLILYPLFAVLAAGNLVDWFTARPQPPAGQGSRASCPRRGRDALDPGRKPRGADLVDWLKRQRPRFGVGVLAVGAVLAFSLAAQVYGVSLLAQKKAFSYRLNSALRQRGEEVVITNLRWVPHALCGEFYQRPFFYVATPRHYESLLQRLSEQGYKSYLFLTQHRGGTRQPTVEVDDGSLNFFAVQFFSEQLSRRPRIEGILPSARAGRPRSRTQHNSSPATRPRSRTQRQQQKRRPPCT